MGRLDVHIRHGGGGSEGAAVAVLALLIVLALIHAAGHAIAATFHVVTVVLEVIGWTLAGLAGAAAVTGTVIAGVRIRRAVLSARARRFAVRPVVTITPASYPRPAVTPQADRPAITPPQPKPQSTGWPLPGWWEEIRPRIGGDSDEHRPQ